MTRILFVPDEQVVLVMDSPLSQDEVLRAVAGNQWLPPSPYHAPVLALQAQTPGEPALQALVAGPVVIIAPARPLRSKPLVLPLSSDICLTRLQLELLYCLVQGFSTQEIVQRLNISKSTANYHIHRLLKIMQVSSRSGLAVRAIELGLLDADAAPNPAPTPPAKPGTGPGGRPRRPTRTRPPR